MGRFLALSLEQYSRLSVDYSTEETRKALMSLGPLKAPGPDGFQPIFSQRSWDLTGLALHGFVCSVLENGYIHHDTAEALLVLIPKESTPYVTCPSR